MYEARSDAPRVPEITRLVGGLEVSVLVDAAGPFFESREVAFPDATAPDWAAAQRLDADAFGVDGAWNLNVHCFVVRGPGCPVTLVDTGVGPAESPASSWAPVPGRLPDELAAVGLEAAEVDLVVQTHLHNDHVGWAVDSGGVPMFPNARYVVQRDEVAALDADRSPLMEDVVDPLRVIGQLHEVEGRVQLVRGSDTVTVVPTRATRRATSPFSSMAMTGRSSSLVTFWCTRSSSSIPT